MPRVRVIVACVLATLTLPTLAWWVFGPRGEAVRLEARLWRTEIEVERLRQESGSDWCDEMPTGALEQSRRRMTDPSGQRSGLIERCQYQQLAWRLLWVAHAQGMAGSPLRWPAPDLSRTPAGQPGAERLGRRAVYYELALRNGAGRLWTCRVGALSWQQWQLGQRLRLPMDRWGVAHCGDLY